MTNIKVQPQNNIKVTVGPSQTTKVVSSQISANIEATAFVSSLVNLVDVDSAGVQDNYVMQYDSSTQKFKFVDPDQVLLDSLPDIPAGFINALDTNPDRVDNIDFDGGYF